MTGLESVFLQLQNRKYGGTDDVYQLFSQFYESDGEKIRKWVNQLFQNEKHRKCNNRADKIRKEGNELYVKGKNLESLEFYTRALSSAVIGTESYGMALANRSAVLYAIDEYELSLRDIDRCLSSNYPNKLKCKVYIRKIHCYDKMGDVEEATNSLKQALEFIVTNTDFTEEEKDSHVTKLSQIERQSPNITNKKKYDCNIPAIKKNDHFFGAASIINLRCNAERGRYVVAEEDIKRGSILFVEKAYAFAPVFNENYQLRIDKCHFCLKDSKALIPCPSCIYCLYCDDTCRERSWNENHRWECKGFGFDLWCTVSLAFPAFRVFLRNLALTNNDRNDIKRLANYKLANDLVTNISTNKNVLEFLVLTAVILYYLESQTNFFDWLSERVILQDTLDLKIYFGSCLLKNVAQIACNASVIGHWNNASYKYIPDMIMPVATGLYPAVSMMNHSCKLNISIYYINDTIVVTAIDNINKGEEVYNCYGMDYRYTPKRKRQLTLHGLYQFQCLCEICMNPRLEIKFLDTFRCPICYGTIFPKSKVCYDCKKSIDISQLLQFENEAEKYLDKEILSLDDVDESYKLMRNIYNQYHSKLAKCYDSYKLYYFETDQFDRSIESFIKYLEIKQKRWGEYSLSVASAILEFLEELKMKQIKNKSEAFIINVKELQKYVKEILQLRYPDYLINYDALETLA